MSQHSLGCPGRIRWEVCATAALASDVIGSMPPLALPFRCIFALCFRADHEKTAQIVLPGSVSQPFQCRNGTLQLLRESEYVCFWLLYLKHLTWRGRRVQMRILPSKALGRISVPCGRPRPESPLARPFRPRSIKIFRNLAVAPFARGTNARTRANLKRKQTAGVRRERNHPRTVSRRTGLGRR